MSPPSTSQAATIATSIAVTAIERRSGTFRKAAMVALICIAFMMLLALMSPIMVPGLWRSVGASNQKIARSQAATIAAELQIYLVDNGYATIPPALSLSVLTKSPNPYLQTRDLLDPWAVHS